MLVIISGESKDQIKIAFDSSSDIDKWLEVLTNNLKTDEQLIKEQQMIDASAR